MESGELEALYGGNQSITEPGDGVPKACVKQAEAGPRGSRTCVCANTYPGVAPQGKKGQRKDVLPWCRPVGVASTSL